MTLLIRATDLVFRFVENQALLGEHGRGTLWHRMWLMPIFSINIVSLDCSGMASTSPSALETLEANTGKRRLMAVCLRVHMNELRTARIFFYEQLTLPTPNPCARTSNRSHKARAPPRNLSTQTQTMESKEELKRTVALWSRGVFSTDHALVWDNRLLVGT